MSSSWEKPRQEISVARAGRLLFAFTVAAAYAVFLITAPQEFARPQGITLLVLGVLYAFIGTFGDKYREQLGTRTATITYFAIQLSLVAAYGTVSQAIGVFWLVPLPLVAQAVVILPRLGIAAVSALVMTIVAAVGGLNVEPGDAVLSTVMYVVAVAFVIVFSHLVVKEQRARANVERLATELRQANLQLEAYAARVEELAASRERNHLARELHDSATQTMFSITLTAEAARMMLARDPSKVAAMLQRLHDLSKSALAEMRGLVHQLRVPERKVAFLPALRSLVADLRAREGLAVELTVEGEPDLSDDQAQGLLRIVQEALNNVVKHAGVTTAQVMLQAAPEGICLSVRDRGVGFDPQSSDGLDGHYGITSMRERALLLNGMLSIYSLPGEGTRVTIELPVVREGESDGANLRVDS